MFLYFKFNQRENDLFSMSEDPFCHTLAQIIFNFDNRNSDLGYL